MSSGANVFAALQLAKQMKKGSWIVTVLVDRRDRNFAEYPHEHYVVEPNYYSNFVKRIELN